MLQTVASMRVSKYKRKYRVNWEPEWFRVKAHTKKRKYGRKWVVMHVKAHYRTRRTWKW